MSSVYIGKKKYSPRTGRKFGTVYPTKGKWRVIVDLTNDPADRHSIGDYPSKDEGELALAIYKAELIYLSIEQRGMADQFRTLLRQLDLVGVMYESRNAPTFERYIAE